METTCTARARSFRRSAGVIMIATAAAVAAILLNAEGAIAQEAGAADPDEGWVRISRTGAPILTNAGGDTIARIGPLRTVEVLARDGNWVRVRLEGWVRRSHLETVADSSPVLRNLSPQVLAANPEAFRGRLIEWDVQFIALERAEAIRTAFYENEPFILARSPGDAAGFVYIAVSPELLDEVRQLTPLERITVLARVRTGRSRLMAVPVLDLLEILEQER